jgi:HlyD family secretion protein
MKRILIGLAVLLLLGTAAYAAVTWRANRDTVEQRQPIASPQPGDERLVAEGKVVPLQHAVLSLPTGGVLAAVLVAEGDRVNAGQPLLELDRARAEANVAQAEANLAQAEAAYDKLRAGPTPEEIAIAEAQLRASEGQLRQTDGSVTRADRTAAEAELAQAQAHLAELQAGPKNTDLRASVAQVAQAQANLTTQRDQLSAAKTNAQLQMEQRVNDLTRAQSAYATALQNWQYVQDTGKDPLNETIDPKTGKRTRPKVNDRQRQQYYDVYVQAEAALRSAETAVQQARVAYDTARQTEVSGIQLAEQQLAGSQAGFDKLRAGADADELAAARAHVASSRATLEKLGGEQRSGALGATQALVEEAQANLNRLRAGASERDLAVAGAEVQRAQATVKLAQVARDETELRAPFSGIVATLDLKTGEYVAPGAPSVHLADLAAWQIETTDLTELDVVRVRAGSSVTMTFDAIPGLELSGRVSRIRALGENKQGDITYVVTITPDRQDGRLRWNMTASASILPANRVPSK